MEQLLTIDAGLAPEFLEAAKTGVKDADSSVRLRALTLIDKLLSIDAGLATQFLEAAMTGVKDSSSDVRSSAPLMEKLLIIDAGLAQELLEAAQRGGNDSDSDVRFSDLSLIDKLLAIDAGLAPQFLEAAKTGVKDSDSSVRLRALSLMEKLLSIDAGLAQELLEAAQAGIKDSSSYVRSSALSLMEQLLSIDAGLAPECLEAAKTGVKDKDVNVRWGAFKLLRKLAEVLAQPDLVENAFSQLKAQLKKETWRITISALQTALTFTKLIPASAQHWLELVPYGLRDEESETQEAAISLGVELAFHLPDEAIPVLLQDPDLSVREEAKTRFIKRLQDKTVTYSPQAVIVLDQLLQHSTADSELDQSLQKEATPKLLELAPQVAEQEGLEYLNTHFDALSHSPTITTFLKKVMHQTLADMAIDQRKAEFITNCILEHGITATIAPGKRLFVLEETRYQFKDSSEAHLQQIVNSVIEKSESELARQYRTHQPLFFNTGSGLPIAASDIPTEGSVVNDADLTTNTWYLSIMHLSDHHQQAPQTTFLLLEQRNYEGEHVIKKITYAQGQYTLAYDQALNPNAIDTQLREELFGPMEYERTKPRYYATYHTLNDQAAQELLGNINAQAGQEAQDAYQALHQLAIVACQADQDAAGAEQLALEWGAYVPNAQELKKVDLLKLSQGDAVQVRRDSLDISAFGNAGKDPLLSLGDAVIDAAVWERYFGDVGATPPLPAGIAQILNSPCPFWEGKQVRDTHMLVLIPKRVSGQALTLDYLGELIKSPKGGGHKTEHRFYWGGIRQAVGNQSPGRSYWVLMTRDVLPGSRGKSYQNQRKLISEHAARTGLDYSVPNVLEAAVVMLLHHVRSGERLYSDDPWTYTRCRELTPPKESLQDSRLVVGCFSSGGLYAFSYDYDSHNNVGVAGLRKF